MLVEEGVALSECQRRLLHRLAQRRHFVVLVVGGEPAAERGLSVRPLHRLAKAFLRQLGQVEGGDGRDAAGGDDDQHLAAKIGDQRRDDGAAFGHEPARQRQGAAGRRRARAGRRQERPQLLPQRDERVEGAGGFFAGAGFRLPRRRADVAAQGGEARPLLGRKRQVELAQGHADEPRLALGEQAERPGEIALHGGGVGGFREERARRADHVLRLVLVQPLAEEEEEGVAGAPIGRARPPPLALGEQNLPKEAPGAQVIAGKGRARIHGERGLEALDRPFEVIGAFAADAVPIGVREVVLGRGPALGKGLARPHRERGLVAVDGALKVAGAFAADALGIGGREVVLGRGPLLGKGLERIHRERGLVALDGALKVVGAFAADAGAIAGREVVLGRGPQFGKGRARIHRERGHVAFDRPFEVVGAFAADAVPIGVREVVLGRGPRLGKGLARIHRERGPVALDRPFEVAGAFAADAGKIGVREVVLGRGPLLGKGLARMHRERGPVGGDGLLQVGGAFAADAVRIGDPESAEKRALDFLAREAGRPVRDLRLKGERRLARRNFLFRVLCAHRALQKTQELFKIGHGSSHHPMRQKMPERPQAGRGAVSRTPARLRAATPPRPRAPARRTPC